MLEQSQEPLNRVFQALAHPVRREILLRISRSEHSVTELAEPFDMTLEAVSQHIRVLERADLLRRSRVGRFHLCRLDPTPLEGAREILAQLSRFWGEHLDGLEAYLREARDSE